MIDLSKKSTRRILKLHADIESELRKRNIISTANKPTVITQNFSSVLRSDGNRSERLKADS
jgi:hypothetical protein